MRIEINTYILVKKIPILNIIELFKTKIRKFSKLIFIDLQ